MYTYVLSQRVTNFQVCSVSDNTLNELFLIANMPYGYVTMANP